MTFINVEGRTEWAEGLDKNTDPYGGAVYRFADWWAVLMEIAISKGGKLEDIAEKCGHEANTDGITGFMYGCVVSILSAWWIHGEQLRKWYNLKTQIRHEGEVANEKGTVLNPALLTIEC